MTLNNFSVPTTLEVEILIELNCGSFDRIDTVTCAHIMYTEPDSKIPSQAATSMRVIYKSSLSAVNSIRNGSGVSDGSVSTANSCHYLST